MVILKVCAHDIVLEADATSLIEHQFYLENSNLVIQFLFPLKLQEK